MRKQSLDFLKKLLDTPSPSGFEEKIQTVCKKYASQYVDRVYKDVHGNQYHVRNEKAKLRVMLAGHVDEIALQLNYVDDYGYFSFVPIGGIDASVLDGQRVVVQGTKGPVQGVIGRRAIHLTDQEERGKPLKMHEMWIDIGAKDKADALKMASVGDTANMDVGFKELANGRAVARAFDNRIGAFVVIEAMRLLSKRKINCAVYCVTTVQEEIGLRGATTSAYECNPHAGIAVDVGHATDFPNCDLRRFGQFKLNAGTDPAPGREHQSHCRQRPRHDSEEETHPAPNGSHATWHGHRRKRDATLTRRRCHGAHQRAQPLHALAGRDDRAVRRGKRGQTHRGMDLHAQAEQQLHSVAASCNAFGPLPC